MNLSAKVTFDGKRVAVNKFADECIELELTAFGKTVGHIAIDVLDDADGEENQYIVKWYPAGFDADAEGYEDPVILKEGHKVEGVIQCLSN